MNINVIYNKDCLEKMMGLPDNSIDFLCTDPPYGISFMGKQWDKAIPSLAIWKESFRVLKPGAFAFVMCIPRQDCLARMIVSLEEAGFNVNFSSIYWTYASGFPKAQNIGKAVDKRAGAERKYMGENIRIGDKKPYDMNAEEGFHTYNKNPITLPSTPAAKALDGSYGGMQLKPAIEVILVAMKPLSEKTYVDQALKNRKGITWLDEGRIPYDNKNDFKDGHHNKQLTNPDIRNAGCFGVTQGYGLLNPNIKQGRFPANLLCSDDVLNDGRNIKSGWRNRHKPKSLNNLVVSFGHSEDTGNHPIDSGSFSRYFSLDAWWEKRLRDLPEGVRRTFPFLIVPKASKAEKNRGCEGLSKKSVAERAGRDNTMNSKYTLEGKLQSISPPERNYHPTVKPIKLISYLITIGSRQGDVVLDPFIGSGTTAIAAKMLDRYYIGYEINKEYFDIAKARLAAVTTQLSLFKGC